MSIGKMLFLLALSIVLIPLASAVPQIQIISPQNTTYPSYSVLLNWSVDEAVYCSYSLNGGANQTIEKGEGYYLESIDLVVPSIYIVTRGMTEVSGYYYVISQVYYDTDWRQYPTVYVFYENFTYTGTSYNLTDIVGFNRPIDGITTDGNRIWIIDSGTSGDQRTYEFYMNMTYTGINWSTIFGTLAISYHDNYLWTNEYDYVSYTTSIIARYYLNGTYSDFNFTRPEGASGFGTGIYVDDNYIWEVSEDFINPPQLRKYYINGTLIGNGVFDGWDVSDFPFGIYSNGTYFWIGGNNQVGGILDKMYKFQKSPDITNNIYIIGVENSNKIDIYCNDTSNAFSSDTEYFSVDLPPYSLNFVNPTPTNASYTEGHYIFVNVSQSVGIDNCILEWYEEGYYTNETMTVNGDYCYINLTSFTSNPVDIQVYVNYTGTLSVTEKRSIYPLYCGARLWNGGKFNFTRNWSCSTGEGIYFVGNGINVYGNFYILSGSSLYLLKYHTTAANNVNVYNLTIDPESYGIFFNDAPSNKNLNFYNFVYYSQYHGTLADIYFFPRTAIFYNSLLIGAFDASLTQAHVILIDTVVNGSGVSSDTFDNFGSAVNSEFYAYDSILYGSVDVRDFYDSDNFTVHGLGRTYCVQGTAGGRGLGLINSNFTDCYIGFVFSGTVGGARTGNYFNSTIGWQSLTMGSPTYLGLGNIIASKSNGGNNSIHPYGRVISDCVNLSSGSLGQILRQSCEGQTAENINTYTISMDSGSNYNTFTGMTAEYAFDWGATGNMINNSQINQYINLTDSVNFTLVNVTVPVINNVGNSAKYFNDYYLQLRVIDQNGNPLDGVTVNVADTFTTNQFSGSIDESLVKNFHEYYDNLGVITNFEPYNVTASKAGYVTNSTTFVFASDAIIILQLTEPPNVNMTSPEPRVYAKYLIDLNVSADQPIDTWWYDLNGTGNVTFIPNITLNLTSMGDGEYYIYVYGNNSVGMTGSDYENWSIDTTKPIVFITSPANGTKTNTLGMTIYGIAENIHLDSVWTDSIYFDVNSGTLMNWNFTNSSIPEGTYTVNVYANDSLAFVNMKTIYFTIDRTNPVITIISPTNVTYPTTNISLEVSSNETISLWFYTLNGAGNYTFAPNITITGIAGHNVLDVYGIDDAGNIGMERAEFDVAIPPTPVNSGLLASIPYLASLIMLLGGLVMFSGMALTGEIRTPKEIAYALVFLMIIVVLAIQLAGV